MKKSIGYIGVLIFTLIFAGNAVNAQIINGAYSKNDISEKRPMPLPSVREADVFWSKTIWRVVDLREKMNQTLYYPTEEVDGRQNLISLLLDGIERKLITPFDARFD